MDTIYAPATAPGRAGVSIIRVSGPSAVSTLSRHVKIPRAGCSGVSWFKGRDGEKIDHCLVLYFEAGRSFTGEETVELHLHGSIAIVSAVMGVLGSYDALRLAEPGEFTRRALDNGRMSLAEVEALSDLIDAETESQRRQAMQVFSGALNVQIAEWGKKLREVLSLTEALIDFAEEDLGDDLLRDASSVIAEVLGEMRLLLDRSENSQQVRSGYKVVLLGKPNVGKSSLLNALAGQDAAITSPMAGTTRDKVTVRLSLKGHAVDVTDTAGLRESSDAIEVLGIARAKDAAEAADVRVILIEEDIGEVPLTLRDTDIVLYSKCDLRDVDGTGVSIYDQGSINGLIDTIVDRMVLSQPHDLVLIRERQKQALSVASDHCVSALAALDMGEAALEIVSEEIRSVFGCLDFILGKVDVEDLLGDIFSKFCIGK